MSETRLSKFHARTATIELPTNDGSVEKLVITGLLFPELSRFVELVQLEKYQEALDYILFVTLRKAYPATGEGAITDEQLKEDVKLMDGAIASLLIKEVKAISGIKAKEEDKKKDSSVSPTQ